MATGDVHDVDVGAVSGVSYVDLGLFDTPEFGAVYVVDAERPAVVDAGLGNDAEHVLAALEAAGVAPSALEVIAVTHVHLDHAGGAGALAEACPNADVHVHRIGAPHLADPTRLVEGTKRAVGSRWALYPEPVPVPEDRLVEIDGGDAIDLGDRTLEVHHAPGHAPHQVVFHDPRDALVFSADAAGIYLPATDAVQPTSPPPNFDLERCLEDVDALRALDPDVLCYPHFGPLEAEGRLDEYERALTGWVEDIEAGFEELGDEGAVVDRLVAESDFTEAWGEAKARPEVAMNVRGVLHYLERREE